MNAPSPVVAYAVWRSPDLVVFAHRLHADGTTSPLPHRPDLAMGESQFDTGGNSIAAFHLAAAILADCLGDGQAREWDVAFAEHLAEEPATCAISAHDIDQWLQSAEKPDGVPTCRVCGCTEADCRQCIERTGRPCWWVEEDLCSACASSEADTAEIDWSQRPSQFGPCCVCGKSDATVRNLLMISRRGTQPGKGWGCFVCNLPPDGASAVLCDVCLAQHGGSESPPFVEAIDGYPSECKRVPFASLSAELFEHDMAAHADELAAMEGGAK